jgi:hypothetical protein
MVDMIEGYVSAGVKSEAAAAPLLDELGAGCGGA